MALSGVCFVPSKLRNLLFPPLWLPPRPISSASTPDSSSSSNAQKPRRESNVNLKGYPTICLRKRMLNLSVVAVILSSPISSISGAFAEDLELERYTDMKEGFTLLRPHSWIKIDKAGATVLFEEPNKAANNVGVVINPVRLTKLGEFGTPQFVVDKLIQAEKRKNCSGGGLAFSAIDMLYIL
ncbi:hypothetical protein U1Q18_011088 [Sarracenia purpurea var. burkii]